MEKNDDRSAVALLLIDVINDLDFPEGRALFEQAMPMARKLAALKATSTRCGIPVVYVNDNFGRWRSDFRSQVDHCLRIGSVGRPIAELLRPEDSDYFVLKPMHSGFYSTALDLLLQRLGVKTLILTGMATDICVLFTANDAHMRGYRVVAPADCSAAEMVDAHRAAMHQMKKVMSADVRPRPNSPLRIFPDRPLEISPLTVCGSRRP
jgi:nicotinamidase-related amidase